MTATPGQNLHDRADAGRLLGDALRSRRRDLHLTQQDVADLAEVSVRFLHELERGKPGVRLDKVLAVLRALGLHLQLAPGMDSPMDIARERDVR